MPDPPTASGPASAVSPWVPFRYGIFTAVWLATVVSNIGGWMYSAAAGWLMTDLTTNALTVSLVQVANNLPVLLLAFPAGAIADIVDKRKFLIAAETATTVLATVFAVLVWRHAVGPQLLLLFVFLLGAAGALTAPAWQAVVPELVPRQQLAPAVALNSVGVNLSRALGSALGGILIATAGIAAPFWANALSNGGVIGALIWWRSKPKHDRHLPAERLAAAMRTGLRHARHNPRLRATLLRAVAFFVFASAYWALLPLVARRQSGGGPELYGFLLGVIGAGAIVGGLLLRRLQLYLGSDRVVIAGSVGTMVTLVLYALARGPAQALIGSFIGGLAWISVLATLNLSAQLALPDWVRGRGLAIYVMVFFGALTLGSALWGQVAALLGLAPALLVAALGMALGILASARWKLQHKETVDLTPSLHWPEPIALQRPEYGDGPVLVTISYQVAERNRAAFLAAMDHLSHERRRDGAYAWCMFEESAQPGRYLETFYLESWLEHLRQHQRVTKADRDLQQSIEGLAEALPLVTHYRSIRPQA